MKKVKKITGLGVLISCLIFSSVSILFAGGGVYTTAESEIVEANPVTMLGTGSEIRTNNSQALIQQINFTIVGETNANEQESSLTETFAFGKYYPKANVPVYVQDEPVVQQKQAVETETVQKTVIAEETKKVEVEATPVIEEPTTVTVKDEVSATEPQPTEQVNTGVLAETNYTSEVFDLPTVMNMSATEYEMLCYVVQGEASGLGIEHKRIIANVILNRVRSGKFPDTLEGVLTQANQFTTIKNYYSGKKCPDDETRQAVYEVMCGIVPDNSQGALYFYSTVYSSSDNWFETKLTFLFELEDHRFFS